jgi:cytochrome c oxidase subunit 1
MPRRYIDFPEPFSGWNLISSLGSYLSAVAMLLFAYGIYRAYFGGERAAENPWGEGATTLEWTLPSPPPFHQFNTLPVIR